MGIREWLNRLWGTIPADPIESVSTNGEGSVISLGRETYTVPWERVTCIAIQYLAGPGDPERTHYLLRFPERDLRVSSVTPGMKDFVQRLQQVPGLRHRDYRDAMEYGNEYPVVIWANPPIDESQEC